MSNIARHHKKPRFKDEAIDVNELASMSNMRGMLSFLDTKPEDYARLFSNASTPPLTDETESIAVSAKSSDITLPSGSSFLPGSNLHSELELLSHDGAVDENPLASKSTDPQALVPNLYP